MSTIVQYFVPEDNEDSEKCNAFVVYKESEAIRLNDIKENFPLPGEYYYRFKFKFQNKNVWIDFNNDDASLPKYEGKIIMKVSRISWEDNKPHIKNNEKAQDFPDLF